MIAEAARPTPAELEQGALSPGKAAAFSGLSRTRVYQAMADGSLRFFEKGSRGRLIAKSNLRDWMATQLRAGRA